MALGVGTYLSVGGRAAVDGRWAGEGFYILFGNHFAARDFTRYLSILS